MKKVSIAMITYNHEKYIKRALDSVFSQEVNFEYEIVIGNDCSPDQTGKILKDYTQKHPQIIKNLKREKNLGALENLLDVIQNCTGEYVAYLEGDDYWISNDKLQKSVDFLDGNSEYSLVYHDVEIVNNKEEKTGELRTKDISNLKEYLIGCDEIPTLTMVFRKSILDKFGEMNLRRLFDKNKYVGDIQIKALLLHNGKGKKMEGVRGAYRQDSENLTSFSFQKIEMRVEDIKIALFNIKSSFKDKYNKEIDKRIFEQNLYVIMYYLKLKKIKEPVFCFLKLPFFQKIDMVFKIPNKIKTKMSTK